MRESGRKILVVDDEQNMRIALYEALQRLGHQVAVAENGRMALERIAANPPDLVVTDIKMPEMDGIELLGRIRAAHPDMPVVVITGYATVETAVEAMKQGAVDYIIKPFPVEVIEETVKKVFGAGRSARPDAPAPSPTPAGREAVSDGERPVIGRDANFLRLLERAKAVASSKATVLILGESGTGKEVLARYIHQVGDRRHGSFVALNCAALPEGLLESELFGHEKGAFTGAVMAKKGKFELASGGTLLLDEIGEIPLHLQAKLLRVLQEEEVDRLGGREPVKIDVHVLATTNRDLAEAVKEGAFRQDLYYRLNVIPIRLPALRERPDDILLLARFFADRHAARYKRPRKEFSARTRRRFTEYEWPGNVRELENMMERAVLLSAGRDLEPWDFWEDEMPVEAGGQAEAAAGSETPPGAVESGAVVVTDAPDDAPASLAAGAGRAVSRGEGGEPAALPAEFANHSLREVERQMIMQALQHTEHNRTHAAKILGISVRTLRNKLNEYRNQGANL